VDDEVRQRRGLTKVSGMKRPARTPVSELCDPYGILLRRDAVEMGVDDRALGRLVSAGDLVRMRQGAYCDRRVWMAADEAERHVLLCRAVMQQYDDHVVLSHGSSVLVQGGPDWGLDLGAAHLTHVHGGGRRGGRIRHHLSDCYVGDLRYAGDLLVTVPARATVEVACTDGVEAALVQADHFLHREAMSRDELAAQAERADRWPGSLALHPVLHLADGRRESPGETRSDYLFWQAGLPRPEPQYVIHHPDGTEAARVDFAWPELRVVVEFDGKVKYHRFRREGETIEQMVLREKAREDLIRELTGWTVIRLTWADLSLRIATAARIRRAMRPAAA
jgi:hypothetical protein